MVADTYRASLLPILFGCDLYGRTEGDAYVELMGLGGMPETPSMRAGHRFERIILEELVEVACVGWWRQIHESRRRPDLWLSATPDAIAIAADGRRAVLEAKLVGSYMADHWTDGLPMAVRLQVLGQLLAWNRETGIVGARIGDRVTIYRVERDPRLEHEIVDRCRAFIERYVEGDEVPESVPDEFLLTVTMPEGAAQASGELLGLGDDLAALQATAADHKRLVDGARARLQAAMASKGLRLLSSPLWTAEAQERPSGKTTITFRRRRSLES